MEIKWTKDIALVVHETEDIVVDEYFKAGEVHDVDVFNEREDSIDIQFGDGSVAYAVPRDCFKVEDE